MAPARIVFTRDAGRDLDQLYDWITADAGQGRAETILRRIHATIETIAALPGMGRIRRDLDGAPRSFTAYPWIVIYEPLQQSGGIVVLRVIDGRRDLPRHMRR